MITSVSNSITNRLMKYSHNEYIDKQFVFYGVSTIVYTLFSTIGLIVVGRLFCSTPNTLILISIFYINQTMGGGYHAQTRLNCFLTMSTALSISLILLKLHFSIEILLVMNSLSFWILFRFPVVLHPKRHFLKEKLPLFARRSRGVMLLAAITQALFLLFECPLINVFSLGFLLSAISRYVAERAQPSEVE